MMFWVLVKIIVFIDYPNLVGFTLCFMLLIVVVVLRILIMWLYINEDYIIKNKRTRVKTDVNLFILVVEWKKIYC